MNPTFTEEDLLTPTTAARFSDFSKAAGELGLTTSVIGYITKRMEAGLGVVLFAHSTRSIKLTEPGRYFFRKATDLLNDFHAIKRGIDTILQGIETRVRICVNQLFCTPKHTACLLQVPERQSPTCQITVTTEVYDDVWDAIINNQANIAIDVPDTLLDGGGVDYTKVGAIRWAFVIAPDHLLALVLESAAEGQLRLYPNIMAEDTVHTINKKTGWSLHGQESILMPDFNTKCQYQILGEGTGLLSDYMVHETMAQSLPVTRQIHSPHQDSRMLPATQHSATGQMTQQVRKQSAPNGILTGIYQDLLHWEDQSLPTS